MSANEPATPLPCPNPFCDSPDALLTDLQRFGRWYVKCACGFAGPLCDSEAEAIAAWNHRPTQDARVEALIESNKELTKFALYHAIHDEALAGIFLTGWGWDGKEVPRNFVERKRAAAVEAALKLGVSLEGK